MKEINDDADSQRSGREAIETTTLTSVDHKSGIYGKYFNFYSTDFAIGSGVSTITQCRGGTLIWQGAVKTWNKKGGGSTGDSHGRRNTGAAAGQWQAGDVVTTSSTCPQVCASGISEQPSEYCRRFGYSSAWCQSEYNVCKAGFAKSSTQPGCCEACGTYNTSGTCPSSSGCTWNGSACEADESDDELPGLCGVDVMGAASGGSRRRRCLNDEIPHNASLVTQTKPALNINLHIHLTPNFKVVSNRSSLPGIEMYSWLTEENISAILNHRYGPNAAYADANVTFTLIKISTHNCVGLGTCNSVPTQTRWGTFSPWCTKAIVSELDKYSCKGCNWLIRDSIYSQLPLNVTSHNDSTFDVWWFPFSKQGGAGRYTGLPGRNYVEMGQWLDSGEMRKRSISSLARKLSHEIGHGLGLGHITAEQQEVIPTKMMNNGQAKTVCDIQDVRLVASTGRGECWSSMHPHYFRKESTPFGEGNSSVIDPNGELSDFALSLCSSERRRTTNPKCMPNSMTACRRRRMSKCASCQFTAMCHASTATPCRRRRWSKCTSCPPAKDKWDSTTTTTPPPRCQPYTMQACRRRRWSTCSDCVEPSPPAPGYSIEHFGQWCTVMKSNSKAPISTGICNGTRTDCYMKGSALCDATPSCFGVAYHPGWWSMDKKGVKLCLSETLEPSGGWNVIMKVNEPEVESSMED